MSDVLTVVGKFDGIKEKASGWFEVEVQVPGKNYPVRLATKSTSLLDKVRDAAKASEGNVLTFHYKESESSKENPNTGKPYMNRYLEDVEAGATAVANTASGNSQKDNVDWDAKDRRDFRSRAWAQTISAFAHTLKADDEPTEVFLRFRPFQQALYHDIVQELDPRGGAKAPEPPPVDEQQRMEAEYDNEPPPPTDDDIPF
jgi:hypothetical protein